jgi:hypothetical protein
MPFYPGYYPQEIRIETLTPAGAAPLLRNSTLHAYVGGDPFGGARLPANVAAAESLGGYVVAQLGGAASAETRCATARRVGKSLGAARAGYRPHPYAVTPYHADYLLQWDLARTAHRAVEAASAGAPLRLVPRGPVPSLLLKPPKDRAGEPKDWQEVGVEQVDLDGLLAGQAAGAGAAFAPPWLKEGWFHAYLLQAPAITDAAARRAVEDLYRRLVTFAYVGPAERADLERRLVQRLAAGCERPVLGYTVRREVFNSEFSQGIENVAWDSHRGFSSEIFVRTAKLKDFPWNGWMKIGAPRPSAAWNPIAGFTDGPGRLLWAALGDPALLPAPYGAGVVAHRAVPADVVVAGASGLEVPEDALVPEAGTGVLVPVGKGKTAKARVTYRLWASAAHDNTRVTAADALYPYAFAARWSVRRGDRAPEYDPTIEAITAPARQALLGVRVVKVDSDVRRYSDVTFTYVVPVLEVYLASSSTDPQELAALAPPWSAVPWHVIVLMEEAVKRGVGAFSAAEARRRGVRWLDLARDPKTREELGAILQDLARRNHIPEPLKRLVAADDAQTRWAALRQFVQRRGHFLVTNGPYQLEKWTDTAVVLQVFRDLNNPLGVGSYDRFAIPRRAWVARLITRGERLEIVPEIERLEKFQREHRLVREPLWARGEED